MRWLIASLLPGLLIGQQLVITNGRVWTGDPAKPSAEAVLIEGSRIRAVGSAAEIAKLRKAGAREYDARGRLVMPAFADSHIHFLSGSLGLSQVDLTGICTLETIQKAVGDYAKAHPEKAWITGRGWEYYCFPDGRLPTKEDLDAVVSDRPVFLTAYDGHTGWANSRALERADINKATGFDGYGEVVKDPRTGQPTGALKEGAQALVRRRIPAITREEKLAALREGMRLAARLGISSIQNASGDEEELSLYEELLRRGELTLRVSFAFSVPPEAGVGRVAEIARVKARLKDPRLQVRGVKLMIDGVIESYTAAMLAPYTDKASESGSPAWDVGKFKAMVAACNRAGLQVYTHAIGDRGVRITLDAYAQYPNVRNRIEHIETIDPSDLGRFAKLGVLASLQPIHADPDTIHVWSARIGPERVKLAFPWRSLEKAGARVVFSSDWPASISVNPIRGIHNAVNRKTVEGKPEGGWIPEQRVSVESALRGYTTNAAHAEFTEASKGMLRPGMVADVIVLSQDLFAIDPVGIHRTVVDFHVFDGRVVYEGGRR